MVICPIARAVHCTGCAFLNFCPAKTILGDYGKVEGKSAKHVDEKEKQGSKEKPDQSNINRQG
jgi:hypothetical protein